MTDVELYSWVETREISEVVDRVRSVREGNPAEAMRILHTFALRRPINDLLALEPGNGGTGSFHPLDAAAVLALAALKRPVEQAAHLAIGWWEKESARDPEQAPLTDSIVHDVTAQRTVSEVAVFVRACREAGQGKLVNKTLQAFAGTGSGRTSLDLAFLHMALNDEKCLADATALLRMIIELKRFPIDLDSDKGDGIVAALRHLSPNERILENWIDKEMRVAQKYEKTNHFVASLLMAEPRGAWALAEYVGLTWPARRLCDLCEILIKGSDACFKLVLSHVAGRPDTDSLAPIIKNWHESGLLAATLENLLALVVAAGTDGTSGPRSKESLEDLHQTLVNERAKQDCRARLRIAIAVHVDGREGADVAELLGNVDVGRNLRHAAEVVNRRLIGQMISGHISVRVFIDYLIGLQGLPKGSANLTFWAVRALSDPQTEGHGPVGTATMTASIATSLFDAGHGTVGFDLLERCLENEQMIAPEAAVEIVRHARRYSRMPEDERWKALLGATIGRWAEAEHREEIVYRLSSLGSAEELGSPEELGFREDCESIIHAVQ